MNIASDFIFIKGGTFVLGSPQNEYECFVDETPHQVTVADFYIAKTPVTQKQWRDIMGSNPAHFKDCDDCPVENVSWNDTQTFSDKLNAKPGMKFRLPTEAEWEYACRAGTTTPFNTGEILTTAQANYDGNYPYHKNPKGKYLQKTTPVGSYRPNAWGLYDMHGNVWEWCQDWYDDKYYEVCKKQGVVEDPAGPETGSLRVLRGGDWNGYAQYCRSANRIRDSPDDRDFGFGFRLVFVP